MKPRSAAKIAETIQCETQAKIFLVLLTGDTVDVAGSIEPEELGAIMLSVLQKLGWIVAVVHAGAEPRLNPMEN